MTKKSFYALVEHVPLSEIDPEIREKLDVIARVAGPPARYMRTAAHGSEQA